jgi:hypothetical protein
MDYFIYPHLIKQKEKPKKTKEQIMKEVFIIKSNKSKKLNRPKGLY